MPSPRTSSSPASAGGGLAAAVVDFDPVVGDQIEAMIEKPEQQVGFPRARRADQQNTMPVAGGAACMKLHRDWCCEPESFQMEAACAARNDTGLGAVFHVKH